MNIRVVGDRLALSWNDSKSPVPTSDSRLSRTISCWGEETQADLARRRILVVGAGSVGQDVALRLAASGVRSLTVMDFDAIEDHNLDRQIGAASRDVALRRSKIHVVRREARRNATASRHNFAFVNHSICEPEGVALALDHDIIFSCVDRPWPRAVLNGLAYSDLIPVVDGGIAIDTINAGGIRNATWRSHVVRPGRPCMSCNRQLDVGQVSLEMEGLLDDASYIVDADLSSGFASQNVATLSVNVSASLLAQYISFSTAPGGVGDPGPLQYVLSTHELHRLSASSGPHCPYEGAEAVGDDRQDLTGRHIAAENGRRRSADVPTRISFLRWIDERLDAVQRAFDRLGGPVNGER